MGMIANIAAQIGAQLYRSGSTELVSGRDVGRFLEVARSRRIPVLGLEGFRITEGHVVPLMDVIADFSSIASADPDGTVSEAISFLRSVEEPDVWYEVVLAGDQ